MRVLSTVVLLVACKPAASVAKCEAFARPMAPTIAVGEPLAARFTNPVELIPAPGGRAYVLEQAGTVRTLDGATVLDLRSKVQSGGEAGLLGIAVDPDFASSGFVYLHHDAPKAGVVFKSVIARVHSDDGGATLDPASLTPVLEVDQPYSNHNGGKIAFGPDGMLYISFGDGGSGGDPENRAQNKDTLLGKILRIDVRTLPYSIPAANPFASGGGRPEIFAFGLRNMWKFSFDRATGRLFGGDVGQGAYEEVNEIVLGGNYGWRVREGLHCFNPRTNCSTVGLIDPLAEYPHSEGVSITGGYVYRGSALPALVGKYIYGDFDSGRIWALDINDFSTNVIADTPYTISSFGEDESGELFILDYFNGRVRQLLPGTGITDSGGLPTSLRETGCLAEGLLAYEVASPLWSDGATKTRAVSLPEGALITVNDDGDFDFPNGTVIVKTFERDGVRLETRLFMRHTDGVWAGYSYEWNGANTDATLLAGAKTKTTAAGGSWYFPSREECMQCHTQAAGFTLGLETRQLHVGEQWSRFAPLLDREVSVPPLQEAEPARAYLHSNCSNCHRPGVALGGAAMDLRVTTAPAAMNVCDVAPQTGDFGLVSARLLAPGASARSLLVHRMRAPDPTAGRMPPLATTVIDTEGSALMASWADATACP